MLVIRLTRMGKNNEAAYRMVVAEKRNAVKGAHMEVVGFYNPAEKKKIEFDRERIEYWISKGARPSDTLASLLKTNGVSGLEKFIEPRNLKRAKKNPSEAEKAAAAPAAPAAPVEEAAAPAPEEAPVEEAPAAEPAPEAPAEAEADVAA